MVYTDQYTKDLANNYHQEISQDLLRDNKQKLKTELIDRTNIKDPHGWSILDIGCGSGVHAKYLIESFPQIKSIVGLDLSPDLISIAKEVNSDPKIKYVIGSMDDLPFPDCSFDFIFSRNTIHYSNNLVVTFKELNRVLKTGANFYFQDVSPIFSLFLKPSKDYEKKEMVSFAIQGGQTQVVHPAFMFCEYLNAIINSGFKIITYQEYFGRTSQVGDFRIPVVQGFMLTK